MVRVRPGLVAAVLGLVLLLTALGADARVGVVGWVVGLACAAVLGVAASRQAVVDGVETLGPADLVTVSRAVLACAVAALVGEALTAGTDAGAALVSLTVVALALDFVDGRVARHTGTVTAFGGRLDGEADAFLILVLSAYVARSAGAWVLAIGLVRYAYALATWVLPWMQQQLPPRYWGKVVAAFTGIWLVVAASGRLPEAVTYAGLVTAALLLAESFGWDVVWLWRHRARVNRADGPDVSPDMTLERNW